MKSSKEFENITKEIRKELRAEHKRLTVLFKDLDNFISELPKYLSIKKQDNERRREENE